MTYLRHVLWGPQIVAMLSDQVGWGGLDHIDEVSWVVRHGGKAAGMRTCTSVTWAAEAGHQWVHIISRGP